MKVLIAEDDRATLRELEATLVKLGYAVVVARDSSEAWQALSSRDAPKLVVLDWMMPEIDGIEICRKVRQEMSPGSTYIIILTVRDRREDIIKGFHAGAEDYIVKPFDRQTLRARVRAGAHMIETHVGLAPHEDEIGSVLPGDSESVNGRRLADGDLDISQSLSYFGGNVGLLKMIAEEFLKGAPRMLHDIRGALDGGDSEELRRHAHSLKGCLGYFAADGAVRSALRLETIGRAGDLSAAGEAYEDLEAEMMRLKTALHALLKDGVLCES